MPPDVSAVANTRFWSQKYAATKKLIIAFLLSFSTISLFAQEKLSQDLTKQYGIPGIQLICIEGNKEKDFNLGTISQGSDKKNDCQDHI